MPVNNEIKRRQAKRIGVEDFQVYDNTYFFPDGNPLPHGTPDELMEAGQQMAAPKCRRRPPSLSR